jgi:hypothetical protein
MTEVLVRTLRLRGSRATRLARAAAIELPAALERALWDLDDVEIESVSVRLDFDPEGMDDAAIAALWAEAIRLEVLAAGATATGRAERVRATQEAARRHPSRAASTGVEALTAANAWLASPAPRGPAPVAALRLAETAVTDRVIAVIGRTRWVELVLELDRALSLPRAPAAGAPTSEAASEVPAVIADPQDAAAAREDESLREAHDASGPTPREEQHESGAERARRDRENAAASRVGALADLLDPEQTVLDLDTVTRAAGLALLYPWLADACRDATVLHPHREESQVRALTLAAMVDPYDATLASDPFVTLLAGRVDVVPADTPPLERLDDVRASCERALSSFASLLPGFAESSPDFVRQQWVARAGIIDGARNPALLTAATHPLDVVLTMLPYPVALFALPWTRPITVRFRP